jgi:protein involved in polysaccharide export with SLBB domain
MTHPFLARSLTAGALGALLLGVSACSTSVYADPDQPSLIDDPNLLGPNETEEIIYGQFFIGPEDQIRVDFIRHNDYDGTFKVRGDGRLFLHDVGLVDVAGLTVDEAQDLVRSRYGEILVNPSVYLEIQAYSTRRKVAVQGYVARPGIFALSNPRTTIFDILADAGGVDRTEGDRGAILIVRKVEGRIQVARYDEEELFSPSDPNARHVIPYVQDGDYVYVLRTWAAELDQKVNYWSNILRGVLYLERDILLAPQAADALQGDLDEGL